jgi:hypothetical protein
MWSDNDKKNTLAVTGDADHKMYEVLYTDVDKNKTGRFEVHLAKVQDQLIADIAPAEPKLNDSEVYLAHLIPVHSFMLVTYDQQSMHVKTMSDDWFKKFVSDHPDAIKHETLEGNDDNIILTAPTDQLQAFILKNVNTEGAFGDATEFRHTSPTTNP